MERMINVFELDLEQRRISHSRDEEEAFDTERITEQRHTAKHKKHLFWEVVPSPWRKWFVKGMVGKRDERASGGLTCRALDATLESELCSLSEM